MTRPHTLAVRLDSAGDVLLQGPALRALAAGSRRLTFLCGPTGAEAAKLLDGVDDILTFDAGWIRPDPPPLECGPVAALVASVRAAAPDVAAIFTSYHQSALPTALLLRLAGVPRIGAISEDYPGALLDVRLARKGKVHEVQRSVDLAAALGFPPPPGDDGRLRVRHRAVVPAPLDDGRPFVVLHPGASAAARRWPPQRFHGLARLLAERGWRVVVTGSAAERPVAEGVVEGVAGAVNLAGAGDLGLLASVLERARVLVVGNTGPAHLAAATATPVISLFSPVVPVWAWRPWRVPHRVLGDQHAACAGTRARTCPVPGHPCLADVDEGTVLRAIDEVLLTSAPEQVVRA
ncbi:MAG: glycosyltransferase family 9 protein [Candidatus Dormibacteraeota bacterium]|nr:glycosyltransferase family 9 protein [Candidatus Dormibacteraeota bacterium]